MQLLPGANARGRYGDVPTTRKWRVPGVIARAMTRPQRPYYERRRCTGPPPDERVILMPIETMRSVIRQ